MKAAPAFIYPWFDGETVTIDLYPSADIFQDPLAQAEFTLDHLAEEFITEHGWEDGNIYGPEAIESAYKLIDALREAANKVAAAIAHDGAPEEPKAEEKKEKAVV